jgi:hypothetical protein
MRTDRPSPLVAAFAQAVLDAHAKRAHSPAGDRGNVPTTLVHEPSRLAPERLTRRGRRYERGGVTVEVIEGSPRRT